MKAFIALAHLRSHQNRLCSFVLNGIPDGSSENHEVGTGGGAEGASGTHVPLSSGDVNVDAGADPPLEPGDGTGPTQAEAHDGGSNAYVSADVAIKDGGIDDYIEFLCMIDDQHRVGTYIFNIYGLLDQDSKPVVAKSTHLLLDVH